MTFISTGPIASEVSKAIAILGKEGISAGHYDMTFIKPIDRDLLKKAADKGAAIVTVEDGTTIGGLGSAVEEFLQQEGYHNVAVRKIGVPDRFVAQGTVAELRKQIGRAHV